MRVLVYLSVTTATFFFFTGVWWTLKKQEESRAEQVRLERQLQALVPQGSLSGQFLKGLKQHTGIAITLTEYNEESFASRLNSILVSPTASLTIVSSAQAGSLFQQDLLSPFPSVFQKYWPHVSLDFRDDLNPMGQRNYFLPLLWSVTEYKDEGGAEDGGDDTLWLTVYGMIYLQKPTPAPEPGIKALRDITDFVFSPEGAALLVKGEGSLASTLTLLEQHPGVHDQQKASYLRQFPLSSLRIDATKIQ